MACDPNPMSFVVTGVTDGTVAGADGAGSYFFNPLTPNCIYLYTVDFTVNVNVPELNTPIGTFQMTDSGSTSVSLTGSQLLEIAWQPPGPPFTPPDGNASLQYTLESVFDPGVCWSITGTNKNGKKWQRHGPNRLPSEIKIPRNVDPESCIIIEDGLLVPKSRCKLIPE